MAKLSLAQNRVTPGDVALAGGTRQAVLTEPARRLAAAIQAGDDFTVQIHHLAMRVDAQSGAGVMQHWRGPCGMEGRGDDFVERSGLVEVLINAAVDE